MTISFSDQDDDAATTVEQNDENIYETRTTFTLTTSALGTNQSSIQDGYEETTEEETEAYRNGTITTFTFPTSFTSVLETNLSSIQDDDDATTAAETESYKNETRKTFTSTTRSASSFGASPFSIQNDDVVTTEEENESYRNETRANFSLTTSSWVELQQIELTTLALGTSLSLMSAQGYVGNQI